MKIEIDIFTVGTEVFVINASDEIDFREVSRVKVIFASGKNSEKTEVVYGLGDNGGSASSHNVFETLEQAKKAKKEWGYRCVRYEYGKLTYASSVKGINDDTSGFDAKTYWKKDNRF